ncbi:lipopolysaccharide export system permease protein [Desulfocicer vacuolatum DSM 3385]|uniref:Lipopolysaccharide export system permease protein n=1 Tax=Desulfocicer vacuolatum DSM 3385 TaxID=1121400 RepID=A0A1W1ZBN7_9BACT|nr:LPS export ABC transporter permease LptG [Desulfocicer vacuolatum]SMC45825.1 lipopolysaccharide export system permease protein [Desulfocicer vacuolatum DSM 3385]
MSIINRYWMVQFLRFFGIVQFIVLAIFVAVDYLTNLNKFFKAGISLVDALGYVLLKTPFMFVQFTPAGVVLAVIVVFGLMNRNNELLALKAGGISAYTLVTPAVVAGILLSVSMFFLGETVVPVTMAKANYIKYSVIKKKHQVHATRENIWIKSDDTIAHFKFFNPVDQTLSGVSLTRMDDHFRVVQRMDARSGVYKEGQWHFFNMMVQDFSPGDDTGKVTLHDEKVVDMALLPEDLGQMVKKTDEMRFVELAAHIKKVEQEGYDATTYRVDLLGKTAFPFICLIMAIMGAAVGMRPKIKENLPLGIVMGLGMAFLYWILYSFTTSLGYGRMLPPFISAWSANFLFLCVALFYLTRTE